MIAKDQSTPGGERAGLAETFCRDVWAKGYARESSSSTSGFAVCEYKGKSYWKVDPLKIKKTFGGTMGVQAPKAIQQ